MEAGRAVHRAVETEGEIRLPRAQSCSPQWGPQGQGKRRSLGTHFLITAPPPRSPWGSRHPPPKVGAR